MAERTAWSLAQRLNSRILLVTVFITFIVSAAVGVHYGYDVAELEQRSVVDLGRAIASDFPVEKTGDDLVDAIDAKHPVFLRYPDAYEWVVLDRNGDIISTSTPGHGVERTRFPPGLPPEEWAARCKHGGWETGKTYIVNGQVRHIVVVAHSDPAGLLAGLVMQEVLMHIVLPLAPFALLIAFFTSGIIKRTLKPLGSLAMQAARVRNLEDIRPLDPKDAPIEVAELVSALNSALDALRDSIRKERDFLLDASHALRTPLAIVKARLELDGEAIDRNQLSCEVEALIRLTSQLLASANAERLVLAPHVRADLSAIAQDVVSNMMPLAIKASVDLGYSEETSNTLVRGDSDAISHALKNLVENALKHTPRSRSVTVEVRSSPPSVTVVDEGAGVPEKRREQIFSRFSRVNFGDGDGAGLGLSIVRRIMAVHGGKVTLDNPSSGGAKFGMVFPPFVTPEQSAP